MVKPILRALANENQFVRDTALKAGQRIAIINTVSAQALGQLLQLLGDLLYKISGVSDKMTTPSAKDDDNFGTESGQKIITTMLGDREEEQ